MSSWINMIKCWVVAVVKTSSDIHLSPKHNQPPYRNSSVTVCWRSSLPRPRFIFKGGPRPFGVELVKINAHLPKMGSLYWPLDQWSRHWHANTNHKGSNTNLQTDCLAIDAKMPNTCINKLMPSPPPPPPTPPPQKKKKNHNNKKKDLTRQSSVLHMSIT